MTNLKGQSNEKKQHQTGNQRYQYIAAIFVSLATLSTGAIIGWPSQISASLLKGDLGFAINEEELGWAYSAASLGSAFLSLLIGGICDSFGRKLTMLSLIVVIEVGWALIIFSKTLWMLILGRFITGMAGGAFCVTVPLYIDEISEIHIRGTLGCLTQMMIAFGILFSNVVGIFFNVRIFSAICALLAILFGCLMAFMPESPIFFLETNQDEKAKVSLRKLRSKEDVTEEFESMKHALHSQVNYSALQAVKEAIHSKPVRRASLIAIGLNFIKVFSGVDPISAYLSHIFESTDEVIDPHYGTIIFSMVQIITIFVQIMIVDKFGRKILLAYSEAAMALALTLTGISFYFIDTKANIGDAINYVPLASLCLFNVAFNMGMGPISWSICAEIFPIEIKGRAMSVCTSWVWFLAFLNVKGFISVETDVNLYIAYFIYAAISVFGTVFVILWVPETKDKSYKEIEETLSK